MGRPSKASRAVRNCLFTGVLGVLGAALAQAPFTAADVRGIYTNVGVIGSNVGGAVASCVVDGAGSWSCRQVVNMMFDEAGLALDGQRLRVPVSNDGTVEINADGTGLATFVITLPDGSVFSGGADLVITGVEGRGDERVVTEVFFSQHEAGVVRAPGASFTNVISRRIGDVGSEFGNASLQGLYAVQWSMGANAAGGTGVCAFDGLGNYDCRWIANLAMHDGQLSLQGERARLPLRTLGRYQVDATGLGTAQDVTTLPDGSVIEASLDFVITGARQEGAFLIATDLAFLATNPGLPTEPAGSLVTPTMTRIGDALTLAGL